MTDDDWNRDVKESIAAELSSTLSNQIGSRGEVERKAAQVLAADLLTASIIASFYDQTQSFVYVVAILLALVVSLYYCTLVFVPKDIALGMGPAGADAAADLSAEAYYEEYIPELCTLIEENASVKAEIAGYLETAIWAALTAVLLFLALNVTLLARLALQPYFEMFGLVLDLVGVAVATASALYLRNRARTNRTRISSGG